MPPAIEWGETFQAVVGDPLLPPGPLASLGQLGRSLQLRAWQASPYHLNGPSGEIWWKDMGQSATLSWPLVAGSHLAALRVSFEQRDGRAVAAGSDSRLSVSDRQETTALRLAHRWDALHLRWGADLRWTRFGSHIRYEPDYELGCGNETGSSFRLRLYRRESWAGLRWRVGADELAGRLNIIRDGGAIELGFGDPFGARVTALFTDEQIQRVSAPIAGRLISPSGEQRGTTLTVERAGSAGVGWRFNARHSETSSDAVMTKNDSLSGEVVDFNRASSGLAGELTGMLPGRLRWRGEIAYDRVTGTAEGWIADDLPGEFGEAVSGGRLFAGSGRLEGPRVSVKLRAERGNLRGGVTAGYADYAVRLSIKDHHQPSDDAVRDTRLPLSGFSAIWGTGQVEIGVGNVRLSAEASLGAIVATRGAARSPVGKPSKLSAGYLLALELGYAL